MAKLTSTQKTEIINRRASGEKLQTIADAYGVTKAYVSIICKGKLQLTKLENQ